MLKVYNDRPYGIGFSFKGREYFFAEKDMGDWEQEIDDALAKEIIEKVPGLKIKGMKPKKKEVKPAEKIVEQLSPVEIVAKKTEMKEALKKENIKRAKIEKKKEGD